MPKIVCVKNKVYLNDKVHSSEYLDVNRMVELKYTWYEKIIWRLKNGRFRKR